MCRLAKRCVIAFSFLLFLSFAGMAQSSQTIGSVTDQNNDHLRGAGVTVKQILFIS